MIKYTIISNIIGMFYTRGVAERISDKVSSGDFVIDLIRPINIFTMSWRMELVDICSNFLLLGLPVILIYSPFLIESTGYYNIIAVIFTIVLSHLLFLLIYTLLGFLAFILIEIWPFRFLLDETIRLLAGGFIPLAILPGLVRSIAYALPFRFLYSYPLELLFGIVDMSAFFENIFILVIWIIIFTILNIIIYKLAIRKAVIQGG